MDFSTVMPRGAIKNDDRIESENIVTTNRVAAAFALVDASYDAAERNQLIQ